MAAYNGLKIQPKSKSAQDAFKKYMWMYVHM